MILFLTHISLYIHNTKILGLNFFLSKKKCLFKNSITFTPNEFLITSLNNEIYFENCTYHYGTLSADFNHIKNVKAPSWYFFAKNTKLCLRIETARAKFKMSDSMITNELFFAYSKHTKSELLSLRSGPPINISGKFAMRNALLN